MKVGDIEVKMSIDSEEGEDFGRGISRELQDYIKVGIDELSGNLEEYLYDRGYRVSIGAPLVKVHLKGGVFLARNRGRF